MCQCNNDQFKSESLKVPKKSTQSFINRLAACLSALSISIFFFFHSLKFTIYCNSSALRPAFRFQVDALADSQYAFVSKLDDGVESESSRL